LLLGVTHKPNPFAEWDGTFNLPEQSEIRAACAQLVESFGNDETDRLALTSDVESIITLYCKSQKKRFERNSGLIEVLQMMVMFQLPKSDLYNVFFAFVTKYIPRYVDCVKDGRPFDLFRLLVLYHDPELCSFLDSHKVFPHDYAESWFNCLFASTFQLQVALQLLDLYLLQADPFQDTTVRYFVVDARPTAQFRSGHLFGSYNIDSSQYVLDLRKFQSSVREMEAFKLHLRPLHHWCFLGSGRDEEDRYVHMVVSHFLKQGTPLVSLVHGGYFGK
uniref:TBC1 domain family member 23 n=1 Tax=Soboliphyme baturini TaxID=241478 RepID=A0A183IYC9_9BILA